jgi:hypothetical protein
MTKKQLESAYAQLLYRAAKMRMQLMTLATDINSKASKAILTGYRKQILIDREDEIAGQN